MQYPPLLRLTAVFPGHIFGATAVERSKGIYCEQVIDFCKKKGNKNQSKPAAIPGPRGISAQRKALIIHNLLPLMPETRHAFWKGLNVTSCCPDLRTCTYWRLTPNNLDLFNTFNTLQFTFNIQYFQYAATNNNSINKNYAISWAFIILLL